MQKMVSIAKVGAPFGLSGELHLYILSDSIEDALSYKPWYIKKPDTKQWSVLNNESVSRLGTKLLIHFDGINTKEKAALFTNAMIAVPRDALKATEADEFYWVDLIGLKVLNQAGDEFGYVDYILDTGANAVLCCKKNQQEFLIPFIKNYVITVDSRKKQVIVDWQYDY